MNFSKNYFDLLRDTFKFRAYKGTSSGVRGWLIFALIPFSLIYAISLITYGILIFTFKILDLPFEYIYQFVKSEGKDVKHATQAVIYWFAFPILLLMKALMSFIVFFLCITHLFAECVGYIATYGGIRFQPFLLESKEKYADSVIIVHNRTATVVFTAIASVLFAFILFYNLMSLADVDEVVSELADVYMILNPLYYIFAIAFVVISSFFTYKFDIVKGVAISARGDDESAPEQKSEDDKKRFFCKSVFTKWWFILISLLLIAELVIGAVLIFNSSKSPSWKNPEMFESLPELPSDDIDIYVNSDITIQFQVNDIHYNTYMDYIEDCEIAGFEFYHWENSVLGRNADDYLLSIEFSNQNMIITLNK